MDAATIYQNALDKIVGQKINEYLTDGGYYESIPAAKELTGGQKRDQVMAEKVAKISSIVCTVIFALSFIAAIILGALSFGVSIIAIPSAIGLLVFVFPAISRIISVALEYQSKENTDSRRIVNVCRQRKDALKSFLKRANLVKLFKQAYPETDKKDSVLRRDLNRRVKMHLPQIKSTIVDGNINFTA